MLRLDHVVLVGPDLAELVEEFGRRGFVVRPGGKHANGLSHNALVGLDDGSYVELFAFDDISQVRGQHVWSEIAERGGGWADFALASDDLAADAIALRDLVTKPLSSGGRERPDGVQLTWRTARLRAPLPFLIEDVTARDLRVPPADQHPNGTRRVATIRLGARDAAATQARYARLAARGAPRIEVVDAERDQLLDVTFA